MRTTLKSLGHAIDGLKHAFSSERNFRGFLVLSVVIAIAAAAFGFQLPEWIILFLLFLCFLIVELMNTAIERITDTIDDERKKANGGHYHPGIKMAKDVAAGASLLALIVVGVVLVLLFIPHILMLFFILPQA
jgi:diacylglycerol kinase